MIFIIFSNAHFLVFRVGSRAEFITILNPSSCLWF